MRHTRYLYPLLVLICTAVAQAAVSPPSMYNTPPEWAGLERTTFNAWDFTSFMSLGESMVPEISDGYGTLSFAGDESSSYSTLDGLVGVVENPFQMTISLDNFTELLPEKRVWIELNWAAMDPLLPEEFLSFMVFSNSSDQPPTFLDTEVIGYGLDSGMTWNHSVIEIVLYPNPAWEDIVVEFGTPVLLDSVFVHTICQVPEPATLLLLAIGGLTLRRRR